MKTIKIVQNSIKLGVIMLAMLMILQSCVCRQKKVSNNEVETSSYSFDERYIIEVIEDIDSFLDNYNVGYDPSHQSVIDSAALVWEDFKVLIDNRQYEIALDLYEKERPAFLIHHSHSEPRFRFLRDVIWPLMQEYNHPDTALVKYESDLATEYMLQVSAIDMSSEENSYMPPMHHQTIIEYGRVLSLIGRWREALALSEELVNALIYCKHPIKCIL